MHAFSLVLNTVTIKQASLEEKYRLAAEAGFAGLELWDHEIEADPGGELRTRALAARYRLAIEGICPGPEVYRWHYHWDTTLEEWLERRLAIYAAVGAKYIVMPVMGEDGTLQQTAENYRYLCDLTARHGIRAGLEPIGKIRKLASVADALQILPHGHEGAGIILDAFHFFRGGNRLDILPHIDPTSIVAVHLDDAMDLPLHELVGYRHRVYPGDGVFDVEGFCRALFHIGYRGPYVVELFNETYWQSDPTTVCLTAHQTAQHVLARATSRGGESLPHTI
jgi:sugar phosphate isomerase/epimerase